MTTSGTFTFNPTLGAMTMTAFRRIGVPRIALTTEHMLDAREEANYLQAEWINKGVELWTVDLETFPLVVGTAAYTLPATTLGILDCYISVTDDGGTTTDRILMPMSRSDYAGYPNKATAGFPTQYWLNMQTTPVVTFYPVPDDVTAYTFNYYRVRRLEDAKLTGGASPDIHFRYLDAYVYALAARLAPIYAADRFEAAEAKAMQSFDLAFNADVEDTPISVLPMIGGYYS